MAKRQRGTAIVFQDGRCLLVQDRHSSLWALPGGTVRRSELPILTAIRELYEETSLVAYRAWFIGNFETKTTRHHLYQLVAHGDVNIRDRREVSSFQWWNGQDGLRMYPHVKLALGLCDEPNQKILANEV